MRKLVLFAVLTALTATTFAAGRRDDRDRRSNRSNNSSSSQYDNSRSRGNYQSDRNRSRNTRRDDRTYDNSRNRTTYNNRRYDNSRTRGTYDNSRTRTTTRTYRTYRHTPYRDHVRHNRRWYNTRDYHRTIRPIYVYNNRWLRVRVTYNDGYWYGSDYPYFIYNGYRHRYSSFDTCNYELVDSYSDSVQRTFYSYSCSTGYDLCADLRDDLNYYENNYRYFCAERYNW